MTSLIPTGPTPAKTRLAETTICLYGDPKIGKSTWASEIPGALFLPTEPGLDFLSVHQAGPLTDWVTLMTAVAQISDLLDTGECQFRTLVLDTLDNAYQWCQEYICYTLDVNHPGEVDYGQGYGRIRQEWHRFLHKLAMLPLGLVLIGHAEAKEETTKYGNRTVYGLTLGAKPAQVVYNLCNLILYCDLDTDEDGNEVRVVRTKPCAKYHAGDRSGRLPDTLPLDYQAFVNAFTAPNAELDRAESMERAERVVETGYQSEQAQHLAEVAEANREASEMAETFPLDQGAPAPTLTPAPSAPAPEPVKPDPEAQAHADALARFYGLCQRMGNALGLRLEETVASAKVNLGVVGQDVETMTAGWLNWASDLLDKQFRQWKDKQAMEDTPDDTTT